MMKWIEAVRPKVSDEFVSAVGGNQLVAGVLMSRGIEDAEAARSFLNPDLYQPSPPEEMSGMAEALQIIEDALRKGTKIGVWGDFDVDGQTSTTVLVSAFRMLGGDVVYHIPVRATESHGVNLPHLKKMLNQGVGLIVTCDTGIAAHEAVQFARDKQVKFVITDHHDLPSVLPEADVIINSKLCPEGHPLATLPGVGVAYKLVEGLFRNKGRIDELNNFLDLVALGIVADIAILDGETRYLLQRGLKALRNTSRLGLRVLYENSEIIPSVLTEEDISYSLAPRLNSLGRLGDANVIVEFLISDNEARVRVEAERLEGLNAERKLLSSQVFQAAVDQLDRDPSLLRKSAIVLESRNWPSGVVGIVASRLVERYHKPTILLTSDGQGMARGSARSIPGCNISKAIAACEDLLEGFGGHPMAAGMSLPSSKISQFRNWLSDEVELQLGKTGFEPELIYDGILNLDKLSFSLVEEIEMLAPFGPGNPALVFVAKHLKLVSHSFLGRAKEHLKLIVEDLSGERQEVVWWQGAGWDLPQGVFDLAFSARKNMFRGELNLLVELLDFRIVEPKAPLEQKAKIEVIDCRVSTADQPDLESLLHEHPQVTIWSEVLQPGSFEIMARHQLGEDDRLVIWHCPPNVTVLRSVIEKVDPSQVYVYGMDPKVDTIGLFRNRLMGLCKTVINKKGGVIDLGELASAMAHTKTTVWTGLVWLEKTGVMTVSNPGGEWINIRVPEEKKLNLSDGEKARKQLSGMLKEASAFRKYFASCPFEELQDLF